MSVETWSHTAAGPNRRMVEISARVANRDNVPNKAVIEGHSGLADQRSSPTSDEIVLLLPDFVLLLPVCIVYLVRAAPKVLLMWGNKKACNYHSRVALKDLLDTI